FGLCEPIWPEPYPTVQLLRRHRRDLVDKSTQLRCQIREVLHGAMPGYAECFSHLWESPVALLLARQTLSAAAVLQAGLEGLQRLVPPAQLRCRTETLHTVLAWAEQAPPGPPPDDARRRILVSLDDDRCDKTRQIAALERTLAHLVVGLPYVL